MPEMNSATTIQLPNALILLVHLYILEYPHANRPEYDHDMFNARTRGLRERAKIMEDITHYLLVKLEGKAVKTILATYPCHQPVDSLAFRTSLAKYLENLRHQCIYPKGDANAHAWWWKDVVVRKSLLEECSGDKFERLLLALSTHTLMRNSSALDPNTMSELLLSLPRAYSSSLKRYSTIRHSWTKKASFLLRAQLDFKELQTNLEAQTGAKSTKYEAIPTPRLKELVASRTQLLLKQQWSDVNGKRALDFVMELAGLRSNYSFLPSTSLSTQDVEHAKDAQSIPSPLPIAAAHHPIHLKRLRRSVFYSKSNNAADGAVPLKSLPHSRVVVSEILDTQKRSHQELADALAILRRENDDRRGKIAHCTPVAPLHPRSWVAGQYTIAPLNLLPQVSRQFMSELGFAIDFEILEPGDGDDERLEKRIEEIRRDLLPPYPLVPDLSLPRLPPRDSKPAPAPTASRAQLGAMLSVGLPVPPSMSPGKSARSIRRKSVRFSMVSQRNSRPSMFRVFSGQINDEVDRLIDETHDFSTDDEDEDEDEDRLQLKTPRGKGKAPVNRIWTAGTPMSAKRGAALSAGTGPAPALPGEGGALMRLPSISASGSSGSLFAPFFGRADSDEEDSPVAVQDVDATPRASRFGKQRQVGTDADVASEEEENDGTDIGDMMEDGEGVFDNGDFDVYEGDAPSLTLKDILLSASDGSRFNLLEIDEELGEGEMSADNSFAWE